VRTDILVVGGGFGGVAAALAAARAGGNVLVTEETAWIGGQATSQAVPFDEHPWIEHYGRTRSYAALREGIRAYYRSHYPLTAAARLDPELNPGAGLVARLCCEPRVVLAVLEQMLAPHRAAGRIETLLHTRAVAAHTKGDRITAVTLEDLHSGLRTTVEAPMVLDATELGDLLPLADAEYVTGAESRSETGEPSAVEGPAELQTMQAFTHTFALSHHPGQEHVIDRPADYDRYRDGFRMGVELGHTLFEPAGSDRREYDPVSKWLYRRILYAGNFAPGAFASDITLACWGWNQYGDGSIIDVPEKEKAHHLEQARQKSLSTIYWLQTEAPRPEDGGAGYPGLKPRGDVMGTGDGLAMAPYIRESRRIRAEHTILEQQIRRPDGPELFADSVGVGCYRIDIHSGSRGKKLRTTDFDQSVWPFQIPLGSLIPVRMENLLPACKNLGVTHVTNGCYRLHPIEWNIGEAAGALAAFCLKEGLAPRQVRNTPELLADFQTLLTRQGMELAWPAMEHAISYHKWAIRQPHWTWGESDRGDLWIP
jgi:hypothetical protein